VAGLPIIGAAGGVASIKAHCCGHHLTEMLDVVGRPEARRAHSWTASGQAGPAWTAGPALDSRARSGQQGCLGHGPSTMAHRPKELTLIEINDWSPAIF